MTSVIRNFTVSAIKSRQVIHLHTLLLLSIVALVIKILLLPLSSNIQMWGFVTNSRVSWLHHYARNPSDIP
uniref:7TM_GPCR_Srx domain-containing protein n=1 Tax=Caenorhabditis tropicalis TaxID=1561998 RepID=A0A1I7UCC0_9PELO